jgi:hypothetical protein
MRCVVDRTPDSWVPPAAPTITERRLGYFGASWQLLEEYIDHDAPLATAVSDIDEVDQLVWGLRHVDDLALRRANANYAGGADTDYTDSSDRAGDQFLPISSAHDGRAARCRLHRPTLPRAEGSRASPSRCIWRSVHSCW